jgi:hypothetical protein
MSTIILSVTLTLTTTWSRFVGIVGNIVGTPILGGVRSPITYEPAADTFSLPCPQIGFWTVLVFPSVLAVDLIMLATLLPIAGAYCNMSAAQAAA